MVRLLASYSNHLPHLERLVSKLAELGKRKSELPYQRPRRARQLDEATVDSLVAAYHSGTSGPQLAVQFGINESTVYAHLKRREAHRPPQRKLSGERLQQTLDLYRGGASIREVGTTIGVSKTAVHMALADAGIERRPRRSKPDQA